MIHTCIVKRGHVSLFSHHIYIYSTLCLLLCVTESFADFKFGNQKP